MTQRELINKQEIRQLSPLLRNPLGRAVVDAVFHITGMNRFNRSYNQAYEHKGVACAHASLREWGVSLNIIHPERLAQLPHGRFVALSNHPYGILDGIAMLSIIGQHRDTFMMIANELLMRWEPMASRFLPVRPKCDKKQHHSNAPHVSRILSHLHSGGSIGLFPAGDVSRLSPTQGITDAPWHLSSMRFIIEARCPVVPLFFHGRNSNTFYLLGLIHNKLRMIFSPRELFNKHKPINVTIGQPIPWEKIAHLTTPEELCQYLRYKTYQLTSNPSPPHIPTTPTPSPPPNTHAKKTAYKRDKTQNNHYICHPLNIALTH